ncbi:ABC transporter permease subunit [Mycoplasma mycoides subsp. capri]|uniref:spermidine/putrescine ABC transporter permease n=1 Tax=Mycoplasma mycoides TaxID=2102 RepID=UPI001AF7B3D5|nr:ABC transporter permease subunit [Mycoplasma mycoides subsp. capri]
METKNLKDNSVIENKIINQDELEHVIETIEKQKKRESARLKVKDVNHYLSKTKLFHFTKDKVWPILAPFILVMVILVILPLVSILIYAFIQPADGITLFKISFEKFAKLFTSNGILYSLFLSILYAIVAGMLCVLIGYPIALMMAQMKSKILARNMWVIVTMPMWISMLLKVLGLQTLFYLLADFAIGTPIAIIIGMTYMFLPFAIAPIYDSLESRQTDLEEAALDLGASKFRTFWSITLRSSMPGVLTAFSLVLVQAATSLIVVHYMGGGRIYLVSAAIESYFFQGNDFGYGAAVSVVLAILVFGLMLVMKLISNKFEMKGNKRKWKNS